MKALLEGGNAVAREKWMARWSASDFPEPDPGDPERLRQFIRTKYIDKKWVGNGSSSSSKAKKEDLPKVQPISNILGPNVPSIKVQPKTPDSYLTTTKKQTSNDPFGDGNDLFQSAPPSKQTSNQQVDFFASAPSHNQQPDLFADQRNHQQQQSSTFPAFGQTSAPSSDNWANNGSWDAFGSNSQPQATQQTTSSPWGNPPPSSSSNTGLEGLLLPSQEEAQRLEQQKQQKLLEEQNAKKKLDLVSQLGSMYQQQAQTNQQQMMIQMQQQQQLQQQMMLQLQQAQAAGATPQQLQHMQMQFMQQLQKMQQQQQQPPSTFPGGFGGGFGAPQQPGGFGGGGFGAPQQPGGFGGGFDSLTPQQPSIFAEEVKPAEPTPPPKADPFANLSPFAMGGAPKTSAPQQINTNSSAAKDPFGFGSSPNAAPARQNNDPFGADPFGGSAPAPAQSNQNFNPFF
eukprot:TRINITY_DN2041_c0_g1_i1.p1 TRINITY_DN2041_c0_g1~~TRINITY_DN2041_c0_g1_i1.p1  ORF type:complete len:455 (-),score=162.34 TRINITY_DN2041_c0_g1_i1:78-1442(-)